MIETRKSEEKNLLALWRCDFICKCKTQEEEEEEEPNNGGRAGKEGKYSALQPLIVQFVPLVDTDPNQVTL